MSGWDAVWGRRTLEPAPSTLAALMAADGLDGPASTVSEESWRSGARRLARSLELSPGASILEVGCGAGAFLYDFYERGHPVAGIDRSRALVEIASSVMPEGSFRVADAAELAPSERADAVVCFGVLMYFPSLGYARTVLEAMSRAARHAVAVLDVPDAALRSVDLARRVDILGGIGAYEERYRGLDHLYYERDWLAGTLSDCDLERVRLADQWIDGYGNAPYRFNAWGFVPAAPPTVGGRTP